MARRAAPSFVPAVLSRPRARTLVPVALAACALLGLTPPAGAAARSSPPYAPPVDAPLADSFRPPADRFSAGNRGVDYATAPDTPVLASGPGLVTFAGPVGGSLHVVVLHPDGLRTSYSFLARTTVRRGDRVQRGDVVGTTGSAPLHFGVRVEDEYVDPMSILSAGGPGVRARLLPDDGRGLPPESKERRALERLVGAVRRNAASQAAALAWLARKGAPLARLGSPTSAAVLAQELYAVLRDSRLAETVAALVHSTELGTPFTVAAVMAQRQMQDGPCTPSGTPPPPRPAAASGRRIAVLVAGLGSTSGNASIDELDTEALGYRAEDTVRFSYRGGTTDQRPYGADDTQQHPAESGRRLRALLDDVAARHPGVPIDVFAHSLGGLVARSALAPAPGAAAEPAPPVDRLVTFGTPHDGADLALVPTAAVSGPTGSLINGIAAAARPLGLSPARPVVKELQPHSDFLVDLERRGLHPGVQATSIAARRDPVVPPARSWLPGATNVVVRGRGLNAHSELPGSPEAHREAALALAGRPPTCESAVDALVDTGSAVAVQLVEAAAVVATRARSGALR